MSQDWGYTDADGPSTWPEKYPLAGGSRQSPVDIPTDQVTSDSSLESRPLTWRYVPENCLGIVNPGYSWRVDVDGQDSVKAIDKATDRAIDEDIAKEDKRNMERPYWRKRVVAKDRGKLTGGPLHGTYKLEQFHCHWGRSNTEGSEHTVDGKPYAGELHVVHWNCEKYPSFSEAVQHPDGLAVLGVLLQVGEESHEEIEKIVQLIPHIQFKGQKIPTGTIDPAKFLPADVSYWTYPGSLTTPPCSESVIWIIFKQPVTVSERQVEAFRTLRTYSPDEICPCEGEGQVLYNYRPPLPLGNRIMRECGFM